MRIMNRQFTLTLILFGVTAMAFQALSEQTKDCDEAARRSSTICAAVPAIIGIDPGNVSMNTLANMAASNYLANQMAFQNHFIACSTAATKCFSVCKNEFQQESSISRQYQQQSSIAYANGDHSSANHLLDKSIAHGNVSGRARQKMNTCNKRDLNIATQSDAQAKAFALGNLKAVQLRAVTSTGQ